MKVREASAEGTTKKLTAEKSIHIRPASIVTRGGFGHFGVNTAESGRNGTGCVFIMAGRKKRVLPAGRNSAQTQNSIRH